MQIEMKVNISIGVSDRTDSVRLLHRPETAMPKELKTAFMRNND